MLEQCGFERVTWSEKDVVIYSPNWWQLFRSECGRDSATRRMPTWAKSASRDELQTFSTRDDGGRRPLARRLNSGWDLLDDEPPACR